MTGDARVQLRAIDCQLRQIVRYALQNDAQRLFIRGLLRDCLALVERVPEHHERLVQTPRGAQQ
jgi:hypothetical protein